MSCFCEGDESCYQRGRIAKRLLRALLVKRKRVFVKRESVGLAATFATAQPCGLHSGLDAIGCQQADMQAD
jgi:hypothetical protein